jgi:WhiB family redox-sensing transcriptional regulator
MDVHEQPIRSLRGDADPSSLPCASLGTDLWFSHRPDDLELAKDLCRTCPVMRTCREGALERAEPWGVWGGEIFDAGVIVPRKRGVGRPRKDDRPAA